MQAPWKQTRCRVHVQHRLSVFGSRAADSFLLRPVFVGCFGGGGVCGGLFVICIVVVSIFIFLLCGFV